MKWSLVFLLSAFGLVMGFGTVYFIPVTIEPFCWGLIFVISAFIIAKYCREEYFLNGLALSIINAIWMTVLHLTFFSAYAANHVTEMEIIERLLMPDEPQIILFFVGILSGAASGVVLGLLSFNAAKLINNNSYSNSALSI
jgi:hypothetical protein